MANTENRYPHRKKPIAYTYETRPFTGKIVTDPATHKKTLQISHPRYYQHEINKFKEGQDVTMNITNKKPKRSLAQNSYYWGVYLPLISRETGEQDLQALHELFKGKFLTIKIRRVLGQPVRLERSTAELSSGEFSNYIANIYVETGIEPPPTENYGLAPLHSLSPSPVINPTQ